MVDLVWITQRNGGYKRWKNKHHKAACQQEDCKPIANTPPHQNGIMKRSADSNVSVVSHDGKKYTLCAYHEKDNVKLDGTSTKRD